MKMGSKDSQVSGKETAAKCEKWRNIAGADRAGPGSHDKEWSVMGADGIAGRRRTGLGTDHRCEVWGQRKLAHSSSADIILAAAGAFLSEDLWHITKGLCMKTLILNNPDSRYGLTKGKTLNQVFRCLLKQSEETFTINLSPFGLVSNILKLQGACTSCPIRVPRKTSNADHRGDHLLSNMSDQKQPNN